MPPKLLINAKWRTQRQISGVQRYAEGLSQAIKGSDLDAYWAQPSRSSRLAGLLWEQRTLPRIARDYDTLLCPANMAPAALDPSTQLLVIVHCLRFHKHPESYSRSFVRWYERMIPRVIDRAEQVFTVSECQQTEIESVYPESRGKIAVLRPGLDPAFRPDAPRDPHAPDGRYLISITSAAKAKNLPMLLRAYANEPALHPLVLVGVTQQEADILCPAPTRQRVHALGHVNDPQRVASLLAHADVLLSPSRYESFGLPCLEAMGCGTPVLASDIPAHREVCSSSAVYAHPTEESAWVAAMSELSEDSSKRDELRRSGRARSAAFTWSEAVSTLRAAVAGRAEGVRV